jgi:hypothetical protein
MKVSRQAWVWFLFATFSVTGYAAENPSPSIAPVLQHIVDRARQESDNDRAFDQLYGYAREKITEYRNGSGDLKKREEKTNLHQPNPAAIVRPAVIIKPAAADDQAVSDTHSNVRGQAFKKNDFLLNDDLVRRFDFKLAGQETLNGRQTLVIDFVPAKKDLPERNIKDRFINKAAGRIWVDAADYTLVKADLHLSKPVDVAFGLVGSIWKFNYSFERSRTEDGYWFTHNVNWHLEGREVVVNRTVDYHEQVTDLHKISAVAAR